MKRIAVFCASSEGNKPIYMEMAKEVGELIGARNYTLVYGGGSIGLMGALARGALSVGGKVIGVLPHFLTQKENAQEGIELIMVDSMHERKQKMHELTDACLTLPGGFGTMDELFEMITWGQLKLHQKPMALLNVNQYYSPLIQQLEVMKKEGLLKQEHQNLLLFDDNIERILEKMENYKPSNI